MIIGDCVRAAGGRAAGGVILYTLRYWSTRLQVEVRGHMWRADTEEDWADLVGLRNPQAFRRALKPLVDGGLVEKTVALFNGRRCLHLRLSGDGTKLSEVITLPGAGLSQVTTHGLSEVITPIQEVPSTGTEEELLVEEPVGSKLKAMAEKAGMSGVPDTKVESPPKKKPTKALAVKEGFAPTLEPEEYFRDDPTVTTMYRVWVAAHARAYGKAISTQPWNGKDQKLVKEQLIARVDDRAVLQRAFVAVVESWPAFADYAKKNTEWFSPPDRPLLSMLCKYPAVMVDFYNGHKKGSGALSGKWKHD